ncbi:glycosyltransferase family 4 protein [Bacillus massiliigorillae]|uniref:glycosyltransferase family 4 protein n=1 Tax=Bacillus massiliigorillae TaxID=1243664 RepID=UPI0003A9F380|nr:glycosyltransferase family 4 protein [Bacillus massiliigorillae]
MKKVLFVATVVKKHINAFHIPYLEWFKKNGYETYVCAKNDYGSKQECVTPFCDKYYNLPFERSPFKLNNIRTYKALKKIIENEKFEVIHCHTPVGGVLARLASINARKKGTKIIYTAHGFHFFKGAPLRNWLLYYPIERLMANFTDVLITINKEDFHNAQKFNAKKIVYLPGIGVDIKKFKIKANKDVKRNELGIKKEQTFILSVGELTRRKNHEVVIKALGMLNGGEFTYVICGQGEKAEYLKKLAKSLNVDVKLVGFRTDIAELCHSADLFVFPSLQEGLPVALMEAMATGLPIICSNIRGNTDLIDECKGGYFVNPKDIRGIAEQINKLAMNKDLRVALGAYNTEAIKKFDINNVKPIMENIYKSL